METKTTKVITPSISTAKANRLFWMGRYAQRVYQTLHQLRKHFDMTIDVNEEAYKIFCSKMGIENKYESSDDFFQKYLYDDTNPDSVINMLDRTKSNAMVLREEIMSETLSYIEMSISHINYCKLNSHSLNDLQPITDYMLAFWGSLDERILNKQTRHIIKFGKHLENTDLYIRFDYSFSRVEGIYNLMLETIEKECYICNKEILKGLEQKLTPDKYKDPATLAMINGLFST
ncbi:MAG: alpha-E domain-containing protein [Paludibacter sp.]